MISHSSLSLQLRYLSYLIWHTNAKRFSFSECMNYANSLAARMCSANGNAEHVDYLRLFASRFSFAFTYLRIDSNCFIAFVTSICKYCEFGKKKRKKRDRKKEKRDKNKVETNFNNRIKMILERATKDSMPRIQK